MRVTVWLDAWQMQCCGTPFDVGDEVAWTLGVSANAAWLDRVLGPERARDVDYVEDHHGRLPDHAPVTRGTVRRIRAARCRHARRPGTEREDGPAAGSGTLTVVHHADGWEQGTEEFAFRGYSSSST